MKKGGSIHNPPSVRLAHAGLDSPVFFDERDDGALVNIKV